LPTLLQRTSIFIRSTFTASDNLCSKQEDAISCTFFLTVSAARVPHIRFLLPSTITFTFPRSIGQRIGVACGHERGDGLRRWRSDLCHDRECYGTIVPRASGTFLIAIRITMRSTPLNSNGIIALAAISLPQFARTSETRRPPIPNMRLLIFSLNPVGFAPYRSQSIQTSRLISNTKSPPFERPSVFSVLSDWRRRYRFEPFNLPRKWIARYWIDAGWKDFINRV